MKNLLPRVLWDYIIGALVGVTATVVALAMLGFVLQAFVQTSDIYRLLRDGLVVIGFVTLLGVLLVVTLYEAVLLYRAQGRMRDPDANETESRLLTREALLRALASGAVAGIYTSVVVLVFALLAREASHLNLMSVWLPGLLLPVMLIAAGALAYAYTGADLKEQQSELDNGERGTLLALPLTLSAVLGFLFGAAAGDGEGVVSAVIGALLAYALLRSLEKFRWRVLQRFLTKLLRARGGPTIRVVSTHKA